MAIGNPGFGHQDAHPACPIHPGQERGLILALAGKGKIGTAHAGLTERHHLHIGDVGLIYTWRRKLLDAGAAREADLPEALPTPVFAEAVMDTSAVVPRVADHPAMIIDLPRGKRVSIFAAASPALVSAALKGLR
jgi:hypothetical protein